MCLLLSLVTQTVPMKVEKSFKNVDSVGVVPTAIYLFAHTHTNVLKVDMDII